MSKTMKKIYVIIGLLLAIVVAFPIGAYAILQAQTNPKVNTFEGAYVDVAVIEKGKAHEDSSNNLQEYDELRNTGDATEKVVTVKNQATGSNATSLYARVRLLPSIVKDDDSSVILGGATELTYTFEANTQWKMKDNVFYYTKELAKGEESDVLLKKVTIDQDIPVGYHLEVKVVTDSIVTTPASLLDTTWGLQDGFQALVDVPTTIEIK